MQTIPQRNKKDKFSELQRCGCALTKHIKTAERGRDPIRVELLFRQKAELVARLRECYRAS